MHIIITGASSGIGEALARVWADEPGARLTLVARRRERLEALAASLTVPTHIAAVDLTEPGTDWLTEAIEALGPVDVLVNNAGSQVVGPVDATDLSRAERSLTLDLVTPLRLIAAVVPAMRERGQGTLVQVASMAALAPTPGMTWYNAAKGGLAAASEALAGELAPAGIGVLTVYPGIIGDTALAQRTLTTYGGPLPGLLPSGHADALARAVLRAVTTGRRRLVWPRFYRLASWFPRVTRWMMDRFTPALAAA